MLVRVRTTSPGSGPIAWSVEGRGHANSQVSFSSPAEAGVHEEVGCLFDGELTVSRSVDDGWQGTVSVVGFQDYRQTIVIPQ